MTFGRTSRAEIARAVRSTGAGLRRIDLADQHLTSREVAQATGVSLRQLQWWDEQDLCTPRFEGHSRAYSPHDLRRIHFIAAMRRKGISIQRTRRILPQVEKALPGSLVLCKFSPAIIVKIVASAEEAIKQSVEHRGAVMIFRLP